jgi:alkylhydroperoxidase family enzyme
MNEIPAIVPVSDLRTRQEKIFEMAQRGPVVLSRHSEALGVLLSPAIYNRMAAELKRLQRIIESDRQLADVRAGNFVNLADLPD